MWDPRTGDEGLPGQLSGSTLDRRLRAGLVFQSKAWLRLASLTTVLEVGLKANLLASKLEGGLMVSAHKEALGAGAT